MSNRGRQNVASYLALDLGIDWRLGADWFESVLTDYGAPLPFRLHSCLWELDVGVLSQMLPVLLLVECLRACRLAEPLRACEACDMCIILFITPTQLS